jgi:hypothetical protein
VERSGQVRHRQEEDRARGLALLDGETRESLGRKRWRQPPLTRPALTLAWVLVCVLHALFALALWHEMQPMSRHAAAMHTDSDRALIVRLIDRPAKPRVAQPPEPPSLPEKVVTPRQVASAPVTPLTHEKPRRDAMLVQDHAPPPAPEASTGVPPAIHVFGVHLPPSAESAPATANAKPEAGKPADDRQIMRHDSNRMQYKATRFEKYFPPPNETAGGAVGRHIGDALKAIAKSVCDPEKKSTAANPLCAAPPPPASPMDRDERLNLPPAPLVDNANPPKGPSLESCISEYKAGDPLSSGCPVNTPDLAFKAEMRECIDLFRAGKRLKTWCPLDTPQRAAAESSEHGSASSTTSP